MPPNNTQPPAVSDVIADVKAPAADFDKDKGLAPTTAQDVSATSANSAGQRLIAHAEHEYQEDRLLAAARLLRQVEDESLLKDVHHKMLRTANDCEAFVHSITSSVDHGDGNDDAPSE